MVVQSFYTRGAYVEAGSGRQRLLPEESEPAGLTTGPLPATVGMSNEPVPQSGLLPGTAGQAETGDRASAVISAEHIASRDLTETITGDQVVVDGGPQEGGVVHQLLVDSDQDLTQENIMSDSNDSNPSNPDSEAAKVAAAEKAAAEKAAAEVAGEANEVVIIEPSPTN